MKDVEHAGGMLPVPLNPAGLDKCFNVSNLYSTLYMQQRADRLYRLLYIYFFPVHHNFKVTNEFPMYSNIRF